MLTFGSIPHPESGVGTRAACVASRGAHRFVLAFGAAKERFWNTSVLAQKCIHDIAPESTRTLRADGQCPLSSSVTVSINWMYTNCQECGRQSNSEVLHSTQPQCGTVCRLLCATIARQSTHSCDRWKHLFGQWLTNAIRSRCGVSAIFNYHVIANPSLMTTVVQ